MTEPDRPEAELLLPFERANLCGDWRTFLGVLRNNRYASMTTFPELWRCAECLHDIWIHGLRDLEHGTSMEGMLPQLLFVRAHAQYSIAMPLAFSGCLPEAASSVRGAIEATTHAHRIHHQPELAEIWMQKTDPAHKKAYAEAFEKEKKKRLFGGLAALHHYYTQFSEFFSHSTVAALSLRTSIESTDEFVKATLNYVETNPEHLLKALSMFLDAASKMEEVLYSDFQTRLTLDAELVDLRTRFHRKLREALNIG